MSSSVLITGCSSGFGLETAVLLSQRGWRVFACMRNLDKRGRLDDALARAGVSAEVVQLDVTDAASVERALKEVLAATGSALDAVVNNAGTSVGATFEDTPPDEARRVMETNFFGVLSITRAVLPAMRARRSGRIVLVSSVAALYGTPGQSIYHASKWALEGWAESVAYELEPFGIHVTCVEPGNYRTDIWESTPRYKPENSAYLSLLEPFERFVDERMAPHGRDPKEVAQAVARALEARRPWIRYPVGPDAKAMWLARGIVPRRVLAAALHRVTGVPRRVQ